MKKILIFLALTISANATHAGHVYSPASFVNKIHDADAGTLLATAAGVINPANCPQADWYSLPKQSLKYDSFVRMAMTALASNRKLELYIDDAKCDQYTGAPVVVAMSISRL